MIHDVSLRSVSNSSSECLSERCSRYHHWETNELNFSDQCQTKFLLPKSQNEFYDLLTIPSCTSAMILPAKLKQNIWNMVWFSMLLYKFKSSRCSPCNQSTQRRRKVYRCWVSSSPIKRAKYETCKYNVNHHGWAHHQGETKFIPSNAEKINGFISPQMSIFTQLVSTNSGVARPVSGWVSLLSHFATSLLPRTKSPPVEWVHSGGNWSTPVSATASGRRPCHCHCWSFFPISTLLPWKACTIGEGNMLFPHPCSERACLQEGRGLGNPLGGPTSVRVLLAWR